MVRGPNLHKIKLIMNVCSYLLCGGKKKSFKEPQIIFRGGGLKGWLLLNHAASKGDKTPIFPTTKHETIRKNGKYSQNGEARNRTVKGTFSLKHVSSSLDFQSHFKSFVHITCSWHTPPFFWPFCLITFSSSQRATENEKTDHKRETMKAVSCIYYQVYTKYSISCQI